MLLPWQRRQQVPLSGWFYNIGPGRDHDVVTDEILAILATNPPVLAGCEAIGYQLPWVQGYTLIRDRSTRSRANIFAYVRNDLTPGRKRWFDLKETWRRTKHPGLHEPR